MRCTQNRNVLMLKIWLGTHALFADLTLKVNIFCLVKIRFWLSTETFDIQRALNIQSFTLISFCYPLPLTNLNLLPFYELLLRILAQVFGGLVAYRLNQSAWNFFLTPTHWYHSFNTSYGNCWTFLNVPTVYGFFIGL